MSLRACCSVWIHHSKMASCASSSSLPFCTIQPRTQQSHWLTKNTAQYTHTHLYYICWFAFIISNIYIYIYNMIIIESEITWKFITMEQHYQQLLTFIIKSQYQGDDQTMQLLHCVWLINIIQYILSLSVSLSVSLLVGICLCLFLSHSHTHAHIQACAQACIHAHIYLCLPAHEHMHTHIVHMHMCVHTHWQP